MAETFANNASGTLSAGISNSATSLTLQTGEGAEFPATGNFRIVIGSEIVIVGARTGDTLSSLTRGAESTTAASHLAGAAVTQAVTAGALETFAQAAAYQALSDTVFARKSSNEDVTASTVLQNDNDLTFAITANQVWAVEYVLAVFSGSATPDIKVAISAPAGATGRHGGIGPSTAVAGTTGDAQFSTSGTLSTAISYGIDGGGTTSLHVRHTALVVNGATAGNVVLQWAQDVSNATATTLATNSYMIARRVA